MAKVDEHTPSIGQLAAIRHCPFGPLGISDYMENSEGCLSTKLHRNRRDPRMLINYAKFRSMDDFMALTQTDRFQTLSQKLTVLGVERVAGTYDVVHSFGE